MEFKGTPGPWAWKKRDSITWEVYSEDWGGIVRVNQYPDKKAMPDKLCEADAKLIAAAPDLLEALTKLIGQHDDQVFICGKDDEAMVDQALVVARAALAKALTR